MKWMNGIGNKFLLVGDKFMPEMPLRQPGFTYRAWGPLTKNKEGIEKFMQTGDKNVIYKNEFDMAYGKSKDLTKRTQSDKALSNNVFRIASDPKYDVYKNLVEVLSLMNKQ